MKNFNFLVLVFLICLGLAACGKGGTLEFNNDRDFSVEVSIDIDRKEVFSGTLSSGEKKSFSRDEDFNWYYTVRQSGSIRPATGSGFITGGDTVVIWTSGIFK
jgi:predicted small lipoprotein YifL